MTELKFLPRQAVSYLTSFLKCVEATASWPTPLLEMLYLQLPKEGAKTASERRPIGQGALDEIFYLAYLTEERSAAGQRQAGVFLDCSKCYERVPLRMLEEFALESGVADTHPGFQRLEAGRQLKLDGQSQEDNVKTALIAALGGVWHEARVHAEFVVSDLCVRCGEAVEDLGHIVHHCPTWNAERREVGMPASALDIPPCVKGAWFAACPASAGLPGLVFTRGSTWTDGSSSHSSNPHFRRCGVGLATTPTRLTQS
eukprot:1852514-Amphidinium_carterae.1